MRNRIEDFSFEGFEMGGFGLEIVFEVIQIDK